jgi:sugar lactone lactonase YvrE
MREGRPLSFVSPLLEIGEIESPPFILEPVTIRIPIQTAIVRKHVCLGQCGINPRKLKRGAALFFGSTVLWALCGLGMMMGRAVLGQSYYESYYFSTLAGNRGYGSADGTGSAARFYHPSGVAVDSAGNLYVADSGNNTIRKITSGGVVTTIAGLAGSNGSADGTGSAARFNAPGGVAVDDAGNIYVADSLNQTIRKISSAGVVTTVAGLAGSSGSADGTGSAARFNGPIGVAVDSAGSLYVSDIGNTTIRKISSGGMVITVAGLAGSSGSADGTGSAARFYGPRGIAVDSAENVYVSDFGPTNYHPNDPGSSTIRKISSEGLVTTLAGMAGTYGYADGTGSAARFLFPLGLAVDSAGNVYVAEYNTQTIRKIDSGGVVTTFAGLAGSSGTADGTGSAARFSAPSFVAVDSAGNLYVADSDNNNTIRKISSGGVVTTLAGSPGFNGSADGTGSAAGFRRPDGVAVDNAGNLYVTDGGNNTIRKISSGAMVTTVAGLALSLGSTDGTGSAARFNDPRGVAVDSVGNLYVADHYNNTIRKISSGGVVTTFAGLAGSSGSTDGTGSAARFYGPDGVAVDSAGNVYVADSYNDTIRKISNGGVVTTVAGLAGSSGSADGTGSAARFYVPAGLTVDSAGNVYVADSSNHTIRKISSGGVVTTVAGLAGSSGSADGTGSTARFNGPSGVAVDSAGNLYVADTYDETIRKINGGKMVTTVAGSARSLGNAEGTGSAVRFNGPSGVAVDSAGSLYVADLYNNTIRLGSTVSRAQTQNLSTRLTVLSGDNVLIGGFIITGNMPKKVMIRGIGPSLPLAGVMADPVLQLHKPDGSVVSNDNWKIDDQSGQSQEADIRATTIPPSNDLESALVVTLPPGHYTAILSGKDGGQGVALVEMYDLDGTVPSTLANISTRGFVDQGDNVMIGGFIIGPAVAGSNRVVIRGIGPSLPFSTALQDPVLELHDGNGALLASNDNWGDDADAADIRAFQLNPKDARESALLRPLSPGAYTAILSGKGGTTGVGLIEVYNLQ